MFERKVKIESMTETEIDAIMTLIPEAQFERMAAGTPCKDRNGKHFIAMGRMMYEHYEEGKNDNNKLHCHPCRNAF